MAESLTTPEHVFVLSSIDQALTRDYIRYAICFPLYNSKAYIETIVNRLTKIQQGHLEVVVTLQNVTNFNASFKNLEYGQGGFEHSYGSLANNGMPPSALINSHLTPLPDNPRPNASSVFDIQATFIPDGLIVALYLHHSVSDILGM